MAKFTLRPHGRLQEWIAHEEGYFSDAGLDCERRSTDRRSLPDKTWRSATVPPVVSAAKQTTLCTYRVPSEGPKPTPPTPRSTHNDCRDSA